MADTYTLCPCHKIYMYKNYVMHNRHSVTFVSFFFHIFLIHLSYKEAYIGHTRTSAFGIYSTFHKSYKHEMKENTG